MSLASDSGAVVTPSARRGAVATMRVRPSPSVSREAAEMAIGNLVEEWAALTYACMLDAAMASDAANEPMAVLAVRDGEDHYTEVE